MRTSRELRAGARSPLTEDDRQWWLDRFTLDEIQTMAALWPTG
jgi:gluconate kinase